MYRSGKTRAEIKEPYGVDEFMYFPRRRRYIDFQLMALCRLLTPEKESQVPKEWTGIWDTDGYTKIWVIYSGDGSGL